MKIRAWRFGNDIHLGDDAWLTARHILQSRQGRWFILLFMGAMLLTSLSESANAAQTGSIVYGSYQSREAAESARVRLEMHVIEPLKITAAEVNGVNWFRIVGEPDDDLIRIRERLENIKSISALDGWLLIEEFSPPEKAELPPLEPVAVSKLVDDITTRSPSEPVAASKLVDDITVLGSWDPVAQHEPDNSRQQSSRPSQYRRLPAVRPTAPQEVAMFRIIDTNGYFRSQYLYEGVDNKRPGAGNENQTQQNLRHEFAMGMSSYIYHPNLISLDLRGGPVFESSVLDQGELSNDNSRTNFALAAYATFLRDKPYRGTLYFDKSYPTILVGIGETATTENRRTGGGFDLLAPLTPVPLHFDASRQQIETIGSLRSSEQNIDRMNFRASTSVGAYGSTMLHVHATRQNTRSQNPGLPQQESHFDNQGFNLETRFTFGDNQQYSLTNSVVALNQQVNLSLGEIPDRKERRISLDFHGGHTKQLRSFASIVHEDDRGPLNRQLDRFNGGASYNLGENWSLNAGADFERASSPQLDNQRYGANGSVSYLRKLPVGDATFHYRLSEEHRSQDQTDPNQQIIGEQITLSGITATALSQTRVVSSSIHVTDPPRTREFLQGIDYEVIVIGIETRLQRLAGGSIEPNELLLVDYAVAVGGSFDSRQTEQRLVAVWHVSPYLEMQYQGSFSSPRVTAGKATFAPNKVRSHLGTIRTDWPIARLGDLRVGGRAEYEDRDETNESFTRTSLEAFMQGSLPLFQAATLRAGFRRTQVNHLDSNGDIDLRAIDLNLQSRHRYNGTLSLNISLEQDIGGGTRRKRLVAALRAQARYRRITFSAEIVHSQDQQQNFDRRRTHVLAELRRDFF